MRARITLAAVVLAAVPAWAVPGGAPDAPRPAAPGLNFARLRAELRVRDLLPDRGPPEPTDPPLPARPAMAAGDPRPGRFVRQTADEYRGTGVHHGLYLPTDWAADKRFPVIVEFAPNRWEKLTGKVEDCRLGFDLTGGRGFVWVVMPYVDPKAGENVVWWWGDEAATVEYAVTNLRRVCERYGGDPNAVLLTGFSRGAIACGYLGLRDDAVADVWLGFLPHSHIDGGRFTPDGARRRLARTAGRPTFVTYGSADDGRNESPKGARLLRELGNPVVERELAGLTHTDAFLTAGAPIRREMRAWVAAVLEHRPGTHTVRGRVTDVAGKGVAGVRVQCGPWHWTETDAAGDYAIPSLVPGRRELVASKPGLTFAPPRPVVVIERGDVTAPRLTATAR